MYKEIDQKWKDGKIVRTHIGTGDLQNTVQKLYHLAQLPGAESLMTLNQNNGGPHIIIPIEGIEKTVRKLLLLASVWTEATRVQAMRKGQTYPKNSIHFNELLKDKYFSDVIRNEGM